MNKINKVLLLFLALFIFTSFNITAYADYDELWNSYSIPSSRQKELLLDEADLLSDDEEQTILQKLYTVSQNRECNIAILTVDDHTGPIQDFSDDYFDYNAMGADYDGNGILFMLSMYDREWAISTAGKAKYAFTDYGQEELVDRMSPYLSDDEYYDAFMSYADICDIYLQEYDNGYAIDVNNPYHTQYDYLKLLLISLLCGFGVALIPILVMKSQLHTVHSKSNASGYQSHQGLNMISHEDRFITSRITHTPIPRNDNSSRGGGHGGSTIHTSSSGTSHGGSHGHF